MSISFNSQTISDNLKKVWNWIKEKFASIVEWTKDQINKLNNMVRGAYTQLSSVDRQQLKLIVSENFGIEIAA